MKQSQVASVSLGASGFLAGALALVGAGEHPKSPATDPLRCVDVPVNVYTYNAQEAPTVAIDGSGRSLVAWGSRRQEAGTFGIYGRLIDAEGRAIEGELHLNQFAPNNQEVPAAAFDSRGVAWVAWQSFEQDGDGAGIVLRRFAVKEGVFSPLGNEMLVNQRTAGDQLRPAVATSGDRAIVCWTGVCGDRQIASARLFDADGRPVSDEITIGSGEGHHWLPAPAVLPDGGFVVAWAQRDAQGRPAGIMARRLDRTGAPLGEPLVVAPPGESFDVEPSIDADASGRFVIAWMSRVDRAAYEVRLRRFAADGEPIGSTTTVDFAHDGWLSGVAVACAADGRFAVLANREGEPDPQALVRSPATPSDVAAVVFEADGRVAAGPVVVHARTEGRQTLTIASPARRALWSADGALVVAWQGDTGADSTGVALSTLRPLAVARLNDADRPEASSLTGEPTIDPALLASAASRDAATAGAVPPEFDPFFIPDPPDVNPLNPGPDFGFIGFQATGWTPPDPDIAVGPNHIVVVVNGGIRFFTKDGTLLFDQPIAGSNGFWGEVGATSFVFDPVALYDVFSGRYIVAATEHSDDQKDLILIAVSDDSDPNGTWHKYRFDMTSVGDFIDFPNLGVGTNAVYVTCDYFNTPRGNHIHIFRKSDLLDGLPTTPNVVRTSNNVRSLGTVKAYDAGPRPQYFATAFSGSSTTIQIDSIRTPLTNPVRDTFNLTVPAFAQPPDADQLGTTNRADTIDVRIKNGVYRNGMLYLAHTIGEDATARVRWYRVQMNGWPSSGQNPVLAEWGTQNLGPGVHNWFADIHVDAQGRMAIAFNRSSSQEYISVQRTFRIPTDTPGTLREPVMQQVSTSPETGSRWGDYSGIEEDPADPSAFWNHHEYRTTSWRTWVGRFSILESLPALSFTYPDGRPGIIDTAGGTTFRVQVSGESETPRADSAVLHVDRGGGSFEPFPMTHLGDHLYEATFPSAPCGSTVKYYVSAESTQNTVVRDPLNAPGSFFSADAWAVVGLVFSDDFQTDQGWTVVNENLTDGAWERGVPAGDGSRGDPVSDFDGSGACYLTGNRAGNSDVDGGPTRLISPRFDLSGEGDHFISYARWFTNDDRDIDRLDTHLSNDDGQTWTLIDSVGHFDGWQAHRFRVQDFLSPTSQMRLRFSATDNPNDSVTEAAIDAITVETFACANTTVINAVVSRGTLISGTFQDLHASDDAAMRVKSGFGQTFTDLHSMFLRVEGQTSAVNPTTVDVRIETRISHQTGIGRVMLQNWNTSQFEQVGSYAVGQTDVVTNVNGLDAAKYVRTSDGRVRLQIRHIVVVPVFAFTFDTWVDHVRFVVR